MAASATANTIQDILKYGPITLHHPVSKKEFAALAGRFPELQMEREKDGKVVIMSPVKSGSGKRESIVDFFVRLWHYQTNQGEVFSASTGIELPDGAIKSPDCSWVSNERLKKLPADYEEHFLRVIPDFVAEVRSASDRLNDLKKKMTDTWMANGVRLAWLIDPYEEKVLIYREGQKVEVIKGFANKELDGESVMPGMKLPLEKMIAKK